MVKNKPLICDCCGGTINPRTMRCEFCETPYKREVAGIVELRRSGEKTLTTSFSIDRRALREEGAPIMEYCLNNMAGKMAEQLMPFCDFASRYEPESDRIYMSARLRVVEPCEPGDVVIRRMWDEGLY